ncbi:major facilitator superfamily domain-containing protein [Mycena galericulata]|nr:major facilitator superfamily domain-containing protein [Mycena galericulata]
MSSKDSTIKDEHDLIQTSCSSAASGDDPIELNSSVRRKIDVRLIPLISARFFCTNLAYTKIDSQPSFICAIAGLAVDLDLSGMRYQLAAAAFFVTYSVFEIPSNVLLKLLRPSIWIPSITLCWGIVMVSMAFVKTWRGLIVARSFLGVTEAGLAPALSFCITLWYRRDQQAGPIAFYFSAATLAGAFGGLLAFCIEKMNGLGGLHGWSWIPRFMPYILLLLVTIGVSLVAYWMMIDYPSTATFLTPEERDHLIEVLRRDTAGEPSHFDMNFVWETMLNPKSWLQAFIFVGLLGIVGYSMLLTTNPETQPAVGYAGCVLASIGIFPGIPLTLAWSAGNAGGSLQKAVTFALVGMVGNLGGICASFVYRTQDEPRFRLGHNVVLGFLCMSFVGSSFATFMYRKLNKSNDKHASKGVFRYML